MRQGPLTVSLFIIVAVSLVVVTNRIYDSRDAALQQFQKESLRVQQNDRLSPTNPAQPSAGGASHEVLGKEISQGSGQ